MTERAVQPFSSHTMTKAPKRQNVTHPSAWGECYSGLTQFEPFVWTWMTSQSGPSWNSYSCFWTWKNRPCDCGAATKKMGNVLDSWCVEYFFLPSLVLWRWPLRWFDWPSVVYRPKGKTPSALPAAFASVPSSLTLICTRMMKRKKRSCSSLVGWVPAAGSWDH